MGYDQAVAGDYCFMRYDTGEIHHVVFLAGRPVYVRNDMTRSGLRYYSHTNYRNGEFVSEKDGAGNFRVRTCFFYRIG